MPLTILSSAAPAPPASAGGRDGHVGPSLHLNNSTPGGGGGGPTAATNSSNAQPVEFNHAINYVNKIKNRFSGQPEVYKQFLEILHTYQKDQKAIKEGNPPSGRYLTEAEVYAQVSRLFQQQEDLLSEFGQFLPEATNNDFGGGGGGGGSKVGKTKYGSNNATSIMGGTGGGLQPGGYKPALGGSGGQQQMAPLGKYGAVPGKRPPSGVSLPPPKKPKMGVLRDVSLAEAGKFGTLNEFAFFDKVRKALRSPEVYENFLRCLVLFNQEVISRQELVQITSTFLNKHPDLFKWFKEFVGYKDGASSSATSSGLMDSNMAPQSIHSGRERMSGESAMEIDYQTCKRLGASYCALPKDTRQVCRELNLPLADLGYPKEINLVRNFINRALSSRQKELLSAELADDKENVLSEIDRDCDLTEGKRLGKILLIADIELPDDKENVLSNVDRDCSLTESERKWLRKVQQV